MVQVVRELKRQQEAAEAAAKAEVAAEGGDEGEAVKNARVRMTVLAAKQHYCINKAVVKSGRVDEECEVRGRGQHKNEVRG